MPCTRENGYVRRLHCFSGHIPDEKTIWLFRETLKIFYAASLSLEDLLSSAALDENHSIFLTSLPITWRALLIAPVNTESTSFWFAFSQFNFSSLISFITRSLEFGTLTNVPVFQH